MSDTTNIFQRLMEVIQDRKLNPPPNSYTTTLFQGGFERIGLKIMEEAAELVRAAAKSQESVEARGHLIHESADLLYHIFVMLGYRDIPLADVEAELARRFGVSGLDEKASRK
jgi:phosphoribosyl-ATP pyrophosphohydrolase